MMKEEQKELKTKQDKMEDSAVRLCLLEMTSNQKYSYLNYPSQMTISINISMGLGNLLEPQS